MKLNIITPLVIFLFALSGNVFAQTTKDSCNMPPLPVIFFKKTVFLNAANMRKLDTVVKIAKRHPFCKLKVTGFGSSSYKAQAASWDRVYSVVRHLAKRGFNNDRIIFEYGIQGSNPNSVDLMGSTEDGPSMTPVPVPCLSQHQSFRKGCK